MNVNRLLGILAVLLLTAASALYAQKPVKVKGVQAEERAFMEAKKAALQKAGVMENVWSVFGQITQEDGQELHEAYSQMNVLAIGGMVNITNKKVEEVWDTDTRSLYKVVTIDAEVQKEADVPHADLVIACTSADECNMLSCLIARKLGAKHTIARVRNPIYFKQIGLLKEDLHLSMAVNPELIVADEISRVLLFPDASKIETFVKGRVELIEYLIPKDGKLAGMSLADMYNKFQIKLLVCAVEHCGDVLIRTAITLFAKETGCISRFHTARWKGSSGCSANTVGRLRKLLSAAAAVLLTILQYSFANWGCRSRLLSET